MTDLSATVETLVAPLAEDAGLDLVDVVIAPAGSRTRIRVIVDRKGGVDVGTCQTVSKALARQLDQVDGVGDRYTLEVTSPGTDHPLTDQRSFDRIEGRLVLAVLRDPDGDPDDADATREVRGIVTAAEEDHATLTDDDGTAHAVAYRDIVKATQELPW